MDEINYFEKYLRSHTNLLVASIALLLSIILYIIVFSDNWIEGNQLDENGSFKMKNLTISGLLKYDTEKGNSIEFTKGSKLTFGTTASDPAIETKSSGSEMTLKSTDLILDSTNILPNSNDTTIIGQCGTSFKEIFGTCVFTDKLDSCQSQINLAKTIIPDTDGIYDLGQCGTSFKEMYGTCVFTDELNSCQTQINLAKHIIPVPDNTHTLGKTGNIFDAIHTKETFTDFIKTERDSYVIIGTSLLPITDNLYQIGKCGTSFKEIYGTCVFTNKLDSCQSQINLARNVIPDTDNIYDLGECGTSFREMYGTCVFTDKLDSCQTHINLGVSLLPSPGICIDIGTSNNIINDIYCHNYYGINGQPAMLFKDYSYHPVFGPGEGFSAALTSGKNVTFYHISHALQVRKSRIIVNAKGSFLPGTSYSIIGTCGGSSAHIFAIRAEHGYVNNIKMTCLAGHSNLGVCTNTAYHRQISLLASGKNYSTSDVISDSNFDKYDVVINQHGAMTPGETTYNTDLSSSDFWIEGDTIQNNGTCYKIDGNDTDHNINYLRRLSTQLATDNPVYFYLMTDKGHSGTCVGTSLVSGSFLIELDHVDTLTTNAPS